MTMSSMLSEGITSPGPFRNERIFPGVDDPKVRKAFPAAIAQVRTQLGQTYPLYVDGRDVTTRDTLDSINPAKPTEVIGKVCQADTAKAELALTAAERALASWRDVDPVERARYLTEAADLARQRIFELAA